MNLANELRDMGSINESESFIDAMFSSAKGSDGEGKTKRGQGSIVMTIVDSHGLPLAVSTHAANHHKVRLVQLTFDFYMFEAWPEKLIGHGAYDSDPLDEELKEKGIDLVAPHKRNRVNPQHNMTVS